MSLQIENLRVKYNSTVALDGVSLDLEPGEMFFLLGPSGCGKSTLLRTVAGFIDQFEGDIRIEGKSLKGVPPHKRDFGMVFQNYALFPHMTVEGNVAFGLEARKIPPAERKSRTSAALQLVGLAGLGSRRPGELSGGQQQRVALARALVIRPRVLLLDEPLSNLDAKLRWEMREEIRRIHRLTKITTLYVTHDQKEALSMADRMAILNTGKLEALGQPRQLYYAPPTRFSAEFLGDVNPLTGTVSPDGKKIETRFGVLPLNNRSLPDGVHPNGSATVFCRPESTFLTAKENGVRIPEGFQALKTEARLLNTTFLGEGTLYEIELPDGIRWRILERGIQTQALVDGTQVTVAVDEHGWAAISLPMNLA